MSLYVSPRLLKTDQLQEDILPNCVFKTTLGRSKLPEVQVLKQNKQPIYSVR